jgi:large subunit ribosomal protein L13
MYSGGLKVTVAQDMLANKPERMLELAIHGMLPKTRLGNSMKLKLKVYAGAEHPHQAQQPEVWELRG